MGPVHEPSPPKGEVTPMTQIWHLMWGPWCVDIEWQAYHPALSSVGIGQLPGTQLPKPYENHLLSLRNSMSMYDISQVPDHPTSGSRVQWLSMCIASTTCVCLWSEGLCPIFQREVHGEWSNVFPGSCQWEADFLRRKLILGGLHHLDKREVASDTPEDLRSAVFWTLLMGWATVRILKVPGACDNSMCQGHMAFFEYHWYGLLFKIVRPHHWCWTLPRQVWLAFLLLQPHHSWLELGHHV